MTKEKMCCVCRKPVDQEYVKQAFFSAFAYEALHGTASLTDNEQLVTKGVICSNKCYYELPIKTFTERSK